MSRADPRFNLHRLISVSLMLAFLVGVPAREPLASRPGPDRFLESGIGRRRLDDFGLNLLPHARHSKEEGGPNAEQRVAQ